MRRKGAGFRTSWARTAQPTVALDRRRRVVKIQKQQEAAAAAAEDPFSEANFRQFYENNSEIP